MTFEPISVQHQSKSDPSRKPYTTVLAPDGRLGCDCRGWTVQKKDPQRPGVGKPRQCTHTDELAKDYKLTTEVRGDYIYATAIGQSPAEALFKPPTRTVPKPRVTPKPIEMHYGIKVIDIPDIDPYVDPMLASLFPEGQTLENFCSQAIDVVLWAMEEKFDGHRVIVNVQDGVVTAWSRPKAGKDPIRRNVGDPGWPAHVVAAFAKLTNATYDGEIIYPGGTSSDVTDLSLQSKLEFVVFDIVRLLGEDTIGNDYDTRREYLVKIFEKHGNVTVRLAESVKPSVAFVKAIWARNGEGAILKRRAANYQPSARSRDIIKVKGKEHALMTVVGFKKGKSGPFSSVLLKNPKDNSETTVKTLDMDALKAFESKGTDAFIGRKLWIEYQFRTKDGGYRHPMWDRWENE